MSVTTAQRAVMGGQGLDKWVLMMRLLGPRRGTGKRNHSRQGDGGSGGNAGMFPGSYYTLIPEHQLFDSNNARVMSSDVRTSSPL